MNARFAMILCFILALFIYVGWRLADGFGLLPTLIILGLLFSGILFYRRFHSIRSRSLRHFLVGAVHMEMGFLSFLLTWIVLRDLVFLPLGYVAPLGSEFAFSSRGTLIVVALSLASLLIGVLIASSGPWVVSVKVPIRDLPDDLEGFKIAQLSDMHIGPTTEPETIDRIVRKTLLLEPDMIALTGDIGDGPYSESREAVAKLSALSFVPSFYVTGNHEYYWNGPEWVAAFQSVGLRPLLNSFASVVKGSARVVVVGTPDPTAKMLGANAGPNVELAMNTPAAGERGSSVASAPRREIRVLLAHQPGISGEARAAGIDLQLSGHTHAGQFFPWTLVVKRVHEFSYGLGRTGSTWVYVNPGTGSWGPQVRLGTRTEITLLTLTKEG